MDDLFRIINEKDIGKLLKLSEVVAIHFCFLTALLILTLSDNWCSGGVQFGYPMLSMLR